MMLQNILVSVNDIIDVYCHSKEDNYMMELLASITRRAIDIKLVSYDELFVLTEDNLIRILDESEDMMIKEMLYEFRNIEEKDIPILDMPLIKKRKINPWVNNKRYFN